MTHPKTADMKKIRVTVPIAALPAFREAMTRAAYDAVDTGERVATDDGPDAEAVVVVTVPREASMTRAERVAELLVP